jgi:branched-chain amino acid transport system permease protein
MFGGLFIGLAEALSIGYIEDFTFGWLGSAFSDLVVFSILVVFMLIRPQGIFGKPEVKKV